MKASVQAVMLRSVATVSVLAVLACVQSCAPGGSGGGGSAGGGATQVPAWNGDLAAEAAYATSSGHGAVQFVNDAQLNDIGVSNIVDGQRYVRWNPSVAASMPPVVAEWFRYHELGHHFRDHMHHFLGKYAEYEADAYGGRVIFQLHGAGAVQAVISYLLVYGNAGNADHRSGAERAAFLQTVLAAAQADPAVVPTPPTPHIVAVTAGYYSFVNSTPWPVYVYANGNFLGGLSVGQSGIVAMTPGTYYVQYKDTYYFSQLLGGYYPVVLGEITTVP